MSVKRAVFAIDGQNGAMCSGRLFEDGGRPPMAFQDIHAAALGLERACEADRSPFPSVRKRHFTEDRVLWDGMPGDPSARRSFMRDIEAAGTRGDLGTFLVCVQHRENGSWQGYVTWMEQNKTVNFRSVWEMVQLIDEAVRNGARPEITWDNAP